MSSQEIRKYMDLFESKNPTVGNRIDDMLDKVKDHESLLKSLTAITILFGGGVFAAWVAFAVMGVIISTFLGIVQFTISLIAGAVAVVIIVTVGACMGIASGRTLWFLSERSDRMDETTESLTGPEQAIKAAHEELINNGNQSFADLVIEMYERVKNKQITPNDWQQVRELLMKEFKTRFMEKLKIVLQQIKSGEITQEELAGVYEFIKGLPVIRELVNKIKPKVKEVKESYYRQGYKI